MFDECLNNVQLFFNPNLGSFDASNADCEALDPEGHLAIPSDGEFFERMIRDAMTRNLIHNPHVTKP